MQAETISEFDPVYYKRNGWIGENFIPYEKKIKRMAERKETLCGICAAMFYAEQYEERNDMDADELRDDLFALAQGEVEARYDYEKARVAPASEDVSATLKPDDTDIISRYLNRLIYEPKRDYATRYAAWLRGNREGPEPRATKLSKKVAVKVQTKLTRLVRM